MIKRVFENNDNSKLEDVLSKIDFRPLYKEIFNYLGISFDSNDIWYEIKQDYRKEEYVTLCSINLQNRCGILSQLFKSVIISTSYSTIKFIDNNVKIELLIDFSWEYATGGSNGKRFAHATYDNGNWIFFAMEN